MVPLINGANSYDKLTPVSDNEEFLRRFGAPKR